MDQGLAVPDTLLSYAKTQMITALEVAADSGSNAAREELAQQLVKDMVEAAREREGSSNKKLYLRALCEMSEGVAKCISRARKGCSLNDIAQEKARDIYHEHLNHLKSNKRVFENIQALHQTLMKRSWEETVTEEENLREYAEAATAMGNKTWVAKGNQWMLNMCRDFFKGGYALRKYRRSLHRRGQLAERDDLSDERDVLEGKEVRLLDVGSCYNPFLSSPGFQVTAVDLCPMSPSVLACDFLELQVGEKHSPPIMAENQRLVQLPAESFDAVTISLVLSYLPTPELRAKMVSKARSLLAPPSVSRPHVSGLLLVAEKESAFAPDKGMHPNAIVAEFKANVIAAGFELITHQTLRAEGRLSHVFTFRRVETELRREAPLRLRQDITKLCKVAEAEGPKALDSEVSVDGGSEGSDRHSSIISS